MVNERMVEHLRSVLPAHFSEQQREQVIQDYREVYSSFKSNGVAHVVGAPLVEVNHVSIHPEEEKLGDVGKPLEIYGFIEITNGKGETFFIYNQPENDPDTLYSDEELILMDGEPILSPFPVTKMVFHLMEKTRGLELAHDTLILDYRDTEISLEKRDEKFVYGKDGFATVNYTTFEAAVVPHLDLTLCHKDDCSDSGSGSHEIAIDGDILASYESKYTFIEDLSATLFSVELVDSLHVKCGTSIPLCKSILGVPVYSSLKLQVSLRGLVDGSTTIQAKHVGFSRQQIEGSNGYFVKVLVHWTPGNPLKEMEIVSRQTCLRFNDADHSPSFFLYRQPYTLEFRPTTLMEVFAVVILPDEKKNKDDIVNLYGEIVVDSIIGEFYLFTREDSCPESFPCGKGKTLMIEGPHLQCFGGRGPCVRVELKDVRGYVFCKGFVSWDDVRLNDRHSKFLWYNRRLCSIIEGEYGLVKVHYSIFEDAVRATVRVSFSFDYASPVYDANVSGSIVARYGNCDYTPYDEKYYRSVLFLKSQEASLKLSEGSKISLPLLKSVVSVPKDSFLIIEVDLCTISKDERYVKALKGVAEFEMDSECCWRLKDKDFCVDVSVDWG